MIEKLGLAALRQLDPERAHGLAVAALRHGLVPMPGPVGSDRLRIRLAGLDLPNPVGLAAGFDKNATAVDALTRAGFGFVEVGAATPRPQPGNPQPRLFRLTEDRAAINRFGFNNDGVEAIAKRLADSPRAVPVGLNLGANKDSLDRAADFAAVLTRAGAHVDFATVNVSSPNTEKLRDLQGAAALKALLQGVLDARDALPRRVPVFLKIAPDLDDAEIEEIAAVALAAPVDAIIATNTTLSRDGLRSAHRDEAGGLSGAPLFDRSTRVLARLYLATGGRVPLVGVGGIASAADALRKIRAGATAVQFYTAMVFQGISLASRLPREMDEILVRNNVASVSELVGLDAEDYAKEG